MTGGLTVVRSNLSKKAWAVFATATAYERFGMNLTASKTLDRAVALESAATCADPACASLEYAEAQALEAHTTAKTKLDCEAERFKNLSAALGSALIRSQWHRADVLRERCYRSRRRVLALQREAREAEGLLGDARRRLSNWLSGVI